MKASSLRRLLRFWPPFVFSGIHLEALSDDWRYARVRLKLAWYNRNYVGTHFGGALFMMADPFWMIMTMEALGRDYIVWDKAGAIDLENEPMWMTLALWLMAWSAGGRL